MRRAYVVRIVGYWANTLTAAHTAIDRVELRTSTQRGYAVNHGFAGLKRTWSTGAACPFRSASRTDLCTSMVWRSISGLAVAKATCRRLRVLRRES
jgi:hypothetical protein